MTAGLTHAQGCTRGQTFSTSKSCCSPPRRCRYSEPGVLESLILQLLLDRNEDAPPAVVAAAGIVNCAIAIANWFGACRNGPALSTRLETIARNPTASKGLVVDTLEACFLHIQNLLALTFNCSNGMSELFANDEKLYRLFAERPRRKHFQGSAPDRFPAMSLLNPEICETVLSFTRHLLAIKSNVDAAAAETDLSKLIANMMCALRPPDIPPHSRQPGHRLPPW